MTYGVGLNADSWEWKNSIMYTDNEIKATVSDSNGKWTKSYVCVYQRIRAQRQTHSFKVEKNINV